MEPMGERGRQGAAPLGGTDFEDGWVEDMLRRLDERGALAPPLPPEEQAKSDSHIIRKLSQAYLASRQRETALERVVEAAKAAEAARYGDPSVWPPLRDALGALDGA